MLKSATAENQTIPSAEKSGLLPTPPLPAELPEIHLTENARQVLTRRYVRRGPDGQPAETVEGMFWRVAYHVAAVEDKWGGDVMERASQYFGILTSKEFFPNSPTFTGAGTPLGQLAACFVLPISDDMGRHPAGIFQSLRDAALIQQTGGGNGFGFSRLRPKNTLVKSSAGQATGPVGFLRVYDKAFGEIAQGGSRRGANMAVLRVDHPDIEEFITCKTDENSITNFNISVGITDAFMEAVEKDGNWELRFPDVTHPGYHGFHGTIEDAAKAGIPIKTHKTVRARELFNKIVEQAHHNGEPGMLFLDAANRQNPVPHLYPLESTNPCVTGETLIYTANGLRRADELAADASAQEVVTDARFGSPTLLAASPVFPTGIKDIYRLLTREGYELRLTADHRVMTARGWVAAADLRPGDRVHILNRPGGFAKGGSLEEGRVLGWLVGDGTINVVRAVLSFFGDEKRELAPIFAEAVTSLVEQPGQHRSYPVGVIEIADRDEARVMSVRLRVWAQQHGLTETHKHLVPATVLAGSQEFQRGFLQALFTADGQVNDGGEKGCSVRLSSSHLDLLKDVQRLLLNLGIASRIYENRRLGGYRPMPDGKGGVKEYFHLPQHDLAISKANLVTFVNQVGFISESKQSRLLDYLARMSRGPYQELFLATVLAVEPDGREIVYDLQQAETHSFIANGLVVHNCGEQWLGPYENCCLGSVNLAEHLGSSGSVDWEKLRRSVTLAAYFLDDVVDANAYVPAVPQLKQAAHNARRIGLGLMGLGDLMYHCGVRYGSEEGQEFASQVMEFVRYHAMLTSIELAKVRGPFPAYQGSIYDPAPSSDKARPRLAWKPPKPLTAYQHDWGRPAVDWHKVVEGIRKHGIRNAAQTTIAPTGTIATVAGCEGYGCEPVFALAYIRHVNDNGKDLQLTYTSPLFERALVTEGLDDEARQEVVERVMEQGSCQGVKGVPEHLQHVFVVSQDIRAEEHVRMQAAMQAFVDNSLSKCVTGDTLVLTSAGLVPIASLSDMRLPDQFEAQEINILSPGGAERSDSFYYGGMRETRRVTLAHGFEIEGTPNHRVHVLQADGRIDFKTLDDLKVGDEVVLYMGQQVFGPEGARLPAYDGAFRTNAKEIRFPMHMSAELAYVLGCITSEGSIGQNTIQICNGDRALLERLGGLFEDLFGLDSHIVQDMRRESVFALQVNSRPLRNWLLHDLGLEAGARNKIIPNCILRASRREMAAFLRGLFLDAYMTLDGRMFGIGLASRRLLRQLQAVFLNFGVFSMLHRSAEHAWALNVSGEALELLAAFVEFEEVWKNERIQVRNDGRVHVRHNYATLLPESLTASLRQMQEEAPVSLRSLFGELPRAYGPDEREYQRSRVNLLQGHRMERALAQRIYDHLRAHATPFAQNFFEQDRPGMLYVKVRRIEAGFNEVFDISVPGSHAFIANGLCNHNTVNFPAGASEADVAAAYQLAWKLGCKGITVYVTGSRQKVVLETKATARQKETAGQPGAAEAAPAKSEQLTIWHDSKKPRPRRLRGYTYSISTPVGKAFVTVNENGGNQPFEVFLSTSKAGSETAAVSEAIGRLISYLLRLGSPISPRERLKEVMRQLSGIGGGRSLGFGPNRVRSLPDGVAQALADYVLDTEPEPAEPGAGGSPAPVSAAPFAAAGHDGNGNRGGNGHGGGQGSGPVKESIVSFQAEEPPALQPVQKIGDLCPECGQAAVVNEEGCRKCYACGYSEC